MAKKNYREDLDRERRVAFESVKGALFSSAESNELAEEKEQEIDYDARNEALDYQVRIDKIVSRGKWDRYLRRMVVGGFALSYIMIIAIGRGWLKFGSNSFAVPSVVAAGVLETYGLARIAARYFFSEDLNRKRTDKD